MKQCSILVAKNTFGFKSEGKGRVIKVEAGEKLEVTTSEVSNLSTQTVRLARKGKGILGQGWLFSFEQVNELFTKEA